MVRPMSRGLETRVVTPSIVPVPQCVGGTGCAGGRPGADAGLRGRRAVAAQPG